MGMNTNKCGVLWLHDKSVCTIPWVDKGGRSALLGSRAGARMAFREVHENTFTAPSPIYGHTYSWFLFWEPERTKTNILHLCLRTLHTLHNFYEFSPSNFPGPYLVLLEVMEMWPRSFERSGLPAFSCLGKRNTGHREHHLLQSQSLSKGWKTLLSSSFVSLISNLLHLCYNLLFNQIHKVGGWKSWEKETTSFQKQDEKPTQWSRFRDGLQVHVCVWFP